MKKNIKNIVRSMSFLIICIMILNSNSLTVFANSNVLQTIKPTFNINLSVYEGFDKDIDFMLISTDGEYEYYGVLSKDNNYYININVEKNMAYTIYYYFEGVEEYEIAELQEEYICRDDTLWNLELTLGKRDIPLESGSVEPIRDMTEEEYEIQRENAFKSDLYQGMYEEEIIKKYYEDIKILMGEEDKYKILASGVKNDTVLKYFSDVGGTGDEWENMSGAEIFVFYYAVTFPEIIIKKNSYDYDAYMENLHILTDLCRNIDDDSADKILSNTIRIWDYVWEYYHGEKNLPNFKTEFITILRADKISDINTEDMQQNNDILEKGDESITTQSVFLKFCQSNLISIIILLIGLGTLLFMYIRKNGGIKELLNKKL